MLNYERHTNAVDALYTQLDRLKASGALCGKKTVVFGTSNLAGIIIHYLHLNGIETSAIIDNDASRQGQRVYGVTVYTPAALLLPYDAKTVILIASAHQEEMIQQLAGLGYQKEEQVFLALDLPGVMSDYSFASREGYTELTGEELRESQLRILRRLDAVCRTHHLRYYLAYGTLLGAVRHHGYIPWDDDIDVLMPMQDIIRLEEVLRAEEEFSLISFAGELEYFDIASLMVDNTTVCDFNGFMQLTSGVSIDIFPLTGVPGEGRERTGYLEEMRRFDSAKWNLLYDPGACRRAFIKQAEYMLSFDFDHCAFVGNVLGSDFVRDIFPRYFFEEPVELEFEGLYLKAPKYYHEYLTQIYGDYMQLPPAEKRVGMHYFKAYKKPAKERRCAADHARLR